MALRITDDCICCGLCVPECPKEAIFEEEIFVLNQKKCDECKKVEGGPKCVQICPVDCIVEV